MRPRAQTCARGRLVERPEVVVDNDLSPLADTEVHYPWSARADAEFKIFVGHCGTLPWAPAASPAVLYLTDANGYFGLAVDLIRSRSHRRDHPGSHKGPHADVGSGLRQALSPSGRHGRRGRDARVHHRRTDALWWLTWRRRLFTRWIEIQRSAKDA